MVHTINRTHDSCGANGLDVLQQAQQKEAEDAAAAAANQPFDHFMGNDTGAFAYGDYDQDDKEADEAYAKIEDIMDERRKVRVRPARLFRTRIATSSFCT